MFLNFTSVFQIWNIKVPKSTEAMTHTFNTDHNTIRLIVSSDGKKFKKSTGLSIEPALWNQKAKSLRAKCKDEKVYKELNLIHIRMQEAEDKDMSPADAITFALTGKKTENKAEKIKKTRPTFWEYFELWGKRESSSKRQRGLAVRTVARLMGKKDDWEDIDSAYWFRLQKKMEDEGFSVNYRWNIGARLKVAMHEGFKMKYHNNTDFQEFRSKKEQTEAIALTPDEIELLWNYVPKSDMYAKCRDLFLIGYYTGARFSDYSRLTKDNINNGMVEFYQQKTDDKVVIPASPRLIQLLDRNGGIAPQVVHVVFNRNIKNVAKDAGIDGVVQLSKAKRKADGSATHRWEMVSSHTARRSLITNLYKSGVSAKDCMAISGHKSLSSFERYLKISHEQSINTLKDNPLFK